MQVPKPLFLPFLLAAFFFSAAASTAQAPKSYGEYEEGLRELRFGHLDTAEARLRGAIKRQAEATAEAVARPYGMRFEPYLPHFYLGLCLCRQGRLDESLAAWAESDRQAMAATAPGAAELSKRRRQCEESLQPQAREAIRLAREAARRGHRALDQLWRQDASLWSEGTSRRHRELGDRLQLLESPVPTAGGLGSLAANSRDLLALAGEAEELRIQVETELRKGAAALHGQVAAALEKVVEGARLAAARFPRDSPFPNELVDRLRRVTAEIHDLKLPASSDPDSTLALRGLEEKTGVLSDELQGILAEAEDARLPPKLLSAAVAYFAGRYDEVSPLLGDDRFDRPLARAQAHLLQAAAYFSLSRLARGEAPKHLSLARQAVRSCLREDPRLRPHLLYFSAAFRRFFEASSQS